MRLTQSPRTWPHRGALAAAAIIATAVPTTTPAPALAADGLAVWGGAPVAGDPPPDVPAWVAAHERAIIGVGSDTTETLFERLAADYNRSARSNGRDGGSYGAFGPLGSWRATGSSTITPKAGCEPIARPNGSSPGIAALAARQILPDGRPCIDFARSLAPRAPGAPAESVFLPMARDAITYAHNKTSNVPPRLTMEHLRAIVECRATRWDQVGGSTQETIQPFLPEVGPGLLALLRQLAGITEIGPCVRTVQQDQGTAPILVGNRNALVFYAVGKYIGQAVYGHSDEHGDLVLGNVNGIPATVFNPATRRVEINVGQLAGTPALPASLMIIEYVVVLRDAQGAIPLPLRRLFAGPGSRLCASPAARDAIADHGFLPLDRTTCGRPS